MQQLSEKSDKAILELLRSRGALVIADLISEMGVTSTAVRQRLSRLMADGLVERELVPTERGRPHHRYKLTEKGRRQGGSNFSDLALVLWKEIRQIKEPEIRAGLLQRVAKSLAGMYAAQVSSDTIPERMREICRVFAERDVPVEVNAVAGLPVLTVHSCPYPDLAEHDRSICELETLLFSELLGENLKLTDSQFIGGTCCRFETA